MSAAQIELRKTKICHSCQEHGKEFTIENATYMTRRIGNTNYRIRVLLSESATETFEDKLLRLVRTDRTQEEANEHEKETD